MIRKYISIKTIFSIFIQLFYVIKADFPFGTIAFNEADEVSASMIIPDQMKAVIILQTRYPQHGFYIGLYDLDSCSQVSPSGSCIPTLLDGYYEREIDVRPDPKPKVIWVGGAENKFLLSGYFRKELPTCMIGQYTVGVNFDVIQLLTPNYTVVCDGDFPSQPEFLIWYVAQRDLLYFKDYDNNTNLWRIRKYDTLINTYIANEHQITDESYMINIFQRDGVNQPLYVYYEHDSTGPDQWRLLIKDIDQLLANNIYTVNMKINHAQVVETFKYSDIIAVLHYDYQLVLYNYLTDSIIEEIYFEVYYPTLESFKAVLNENGKEFLLVGSKLGNDRFLRWITVDQATANYNMYKGHYMETDDTYNYNFQEAVSYDANQNVLLYMTSERRFAIAFVESCQKGYMQTANGSCNDQNCSYGCLSCETPTTCIICDPGYTFDENYQCVFDANRGNGSATSSDVRGTFMGHPSKGQYFYDTTINVDTMLMFDLDTKWIHRFQAQSETNDYIDASVQITDDLIEMMILTTDQQVLSLEFNGNTYQMYARSFIVPLGAPVGGATGGAILEDVTYHPTPPTDRPVQLFEFGIRNGAIYVQHVAFRKDDASTQQFYVVQTATAEIIQVTTTFNFDNTNFDDKIFFFGYSTGAGGGGNLLLVKDISHDIHVFTCTVGPLACTDSTIQFPGGQDVRILHSSGTQDIFFKYNIGLNQVEALQIAAVGGFPVQTATFNANDSIKSGIYFENTDGATIRVFATINYDGTVSTAQFDATYTTLTQVATHMWGFKYHNRDIVGNDYIGDPYTYMGWEENTMTVMIKAYENVQKINLCDVNGIYDNGQPTKCQQCHARCQKCFGVTDNDCYLCTGSAGGTTYYLQASSCVATCTVAGEYGAELFRDCKVCDHQCSTCFTIANNCLTCKGDRLTVPNCDCPVNYYDDGVSVMCQICDPNIPITCSVCIDYVCTVCVLNLVNLDNNNVCECDIANNDFTHNPAFTQWCTTCFTGPYEAQLDNTMENVTIEFFTPIQFPTFDSPKFELLQDEYNYELCVHIFDQPTLDTLGEVPQCRRSASTTAIELILGYRPTIVGGTNGAFTFTTNSINRPSCGPTDFFNFFPEDAYLDSTAPATPSISLEGPSFISICEDFDVYIFQEKLDGKRGLRNIVWSTTATDQPIIDVMTYFTNQQAHYFKMPALTLQPGITYTFNVVFENYQSQVGSDSITITTYPSTEGPHIRMIQENYQTFYQSDIISFNAELNYIHCDATTKVIEYIPNTVFTSVTWQLIDANPAPTDLQTTVDVTQQFLDYTFVPYSQPSYSGYGIRLKAVSGGIEAIQQLSFNIIPYPELMCYIVGGSRVESYNNVLTIDAKIRNLDVTTALQDLGITYVWDCKEMVNFTPCQDVDGAVLNFGNQPTITLQPNTLNPFQSLKFRVEATVVTPTIKECIYEVVVSIIDMETPLQLITFPEHIMSGQLNFHDVIQLDIALSPTLNSDEVLFNVVFLYQNNVVASKVLEYQQFNLRILDFFENILVTDPYLTMRVSVQVPNFYMPSQNMVKLYMNYVPQNGSLNVSDGTGGYGLDTLYTFSATGFTDNDQDISFRFSYYLHEDLYTDDVERGYNPFYSEKNVMCDFTPRSICNSMLPLPTQNSVSGDYKAIIMVEAADLKGGIANRTSTIIVNPSQQPRLNQIQDIETIYLSAASLTVEEKIKTYYLVAQQLRQIDQSGCPLCGGQGQCNESTQVCTCLPGYYMRDCTFEKSDYLTYSRLKMEVYNSLQQLRDIQFQYIHEENAVKGMQRILDDISIGQVFNTTFLNDYIADMDGYINIRIQQKIENLKTEKVLNVANNPYQLKIDSIQRILKHCFYSLDSVSYAVNNTAYYGDASFTQFQRLKYYKLLVNLTRDAQSQIHSIATPNDITYNFSGNIINSKVQVLTPKKVLSEVLDPDVEIDQVLFTTDLYDVEGDGVFHVYDSMVQGYKINPYQHEPTYPYPEQETACQDVDLFRQGVPDLEIIPAIRVRYQFEALNQNNSTWNMCITRRYNGVWLPPTWTIDDCETSYVRDGNEKLEIVCTCFSLNPVSVINDYLCIYRECYPEGESLMWYTTLLLYVLIVLFLTWSYMVYKAYAYDSIQLYRVYLEEEESSSSSSEEEVEKVDKDTVKVGNVFEYLDGSRRGKIKRKQKRDIEGEGEQVDAQEKKPKKEIIVEEIEEIEQYIEVYVKMNVCIGMFKLHELFSIFYFYDHECRRVFRIMFWYSKYMMQCASIGYMLYQEWTFLSILFAMIIFACIYDSIICGMKWLMRRKQFIVRLLGFNTGLALLIISWYLVVVNTLWLFVFKSNNWAYYFLAFFFGDGFLFQPILTFIKCVIINLAIGKGHKLARFTKWVFIFFEENIYFRNLLKTAKGVFNEQMDDNEQDARPAPLNQD